MLSLTMSLLCIGFLHSDKARGLESKRPAISITNVQDRLMNSNALGLADIWALNYFKALVVIKENCKASFKSISLS